jgi:capsular polysaccharide biosynthesis protein
MAPGSPQIRAARRWARGRVQAGARAVARPRGRQRVTGVVDSVEADVGELGERGRFEQVHPAADIERPPPATIDPQVHPTLERLRTHRHPAMFRARLPGARIAGTEPLVLTADRRALLESTFDREQLDANAVMHQRLYPPVRLEGPHVCLLSQWSTNFFHWMLDTLPRLALLEPEVVADLPLIVPDAPGPVVLDSLARAGVSRDRLVYFDGTHYEVDELHFPSLVGRTGHLPGWAATWLRETLVGARPAGGRRRLYVSRSDTTWRRVTNEDEVARALEARGFETILPGELSLAEQLEAFATAEAVVGPHGAGLVGLVAAEDCVVVELMPSTWVNGCYYAMTAELGLRYWYLLCESAGRRHDLDVDLRRLERTLDEAGIR